jgi:DNA-binding MarR family transcriptional regulator
MVTETTQTPEALTGDLCWLLSRTSHALTTELTAALEELGLTPRGLAVLQTAADDQMTQSEIARLVGLDKTTMVVTVDELEALGLVERHPTVEDRRVRVVAPTPAGIRRLREADKVLDRVRDDVLSVLASDEREVFMHALRKLACGRLAEPVPCARPVRRPR